MKITRIEIKNFRSIAEVIIEPSMFNVQVGQNNHGKTNYFEALNWFFSGFSTKDKPDTICRRGTNLKSMSVVVTFSGLQAAIANMSNETKKKALQKIFNNNEDEIAIKREGSDPRKRFLLKPSGEWSDPIGADKTWGDLLPKLEYNGRISVTANSYLARMKAEAYRSKGMMQDSTLLITADTVVIIDGAILGKPQDREEAARMLRTLSGRTHQVVTGVCISHRWETRAFSCSSLVTFAHLSDEEIDYYLERYRPYDKAGSYGIQEWIGYIAIQRVEGSFYNVMGLPVHLLYNELKDFGESN